MPTYLSTTKCCIPVSSHLGLHYTLGLIKVRNICFFSPLVPSKWEKKKLVLLSLYIFFREVCLFFNFWMIKLKSKHTSLKKYTNWAKLIYYSLVLREREENKTNISHLWWGLKILIHQWIVKNLQGHESVLPWHLCGDVLLDPNLSKKY